MPYLRANARARDTAHLLVPATLRYADVQRLLESGALGDERLLSPEELDALFKRLDELIEDARQLQQQINERLIETRRQDQPERRGQPRRRRRRE